MRPRINQNDLHTRWRAYIGTDFFTTLRRQLIMGGEIVASPFGTYNNRLDLRGLEFPPTTTFRKITLKNADLSHMILSQRWIEQSLFENVLFDKASMLDVSDHGNKFIHCSFVGTNLRGAHLGYRGSQYQYVKFVKAKFTFGGFIRPEFDDVEFIDCQLNGIDCNAASFCRCTFKGQLKNVWFRGGFGYPGDNDDFGTPRRANTMQDVSFEHAKLIDLTISDGCDLSTVKLPLDGSCRFYDRWKERLEKLNEYATRQTDSKGSLLKLFCEIRMIHAKKQDQFILSKYDLVKDYGDLTSEIMDLLSSY